MKTAVIYARYSSERQTDQSIESQLRVCNEYALRNEILVVDTYIDKAMSGTNDNRRNFQRMLKDATKKAWDIVLVYRIDRFSRNKYEMAIHKKTLRDNGIKLISAMENIPDTPEGIILESLLEGMAEYYSAELSQKVKRGMVETRQKGHFPGGYLLFGYKVVNKKILIDEEKAEIVKYVFSEYLNGKTIKEVTQMLNDEGFYHRGKKFDMNVVNRMLRNTKYIGIYTHDGITYTNTYPQIIDKNIFEKVNQKLDVNKYGKHNKDIVYLLKGKIICGYCGHTISAETGTSKAGKVMRYYKCFGRKHNNNCTKKTIRKEPLENLILNTITEIINEPNNINKLSELIYEYHQQLLEKQSKLKLLLKEKSETEKSIRNLVNAIENGISTKFTKERLEELETKLIDIDGKILFEKSKSAIMISKEEIQGYLITALNKNGKLLIDHLIKKIILFDDKVEIYFNYTNKKSPDDESQQGFLFYKEDKKLLKLETLKTLVFI